ncbi:MAG TPA: GtrA family protein [Spirochaetota bacterium]|nr:GtrA family protein [Spirochaetota bacterium]
MQKIFSNSKLNIFNIKTFFQAVRFGIVGVTNTLVCFAVIFLCLKIFKLSYIVSNVFGYIVGFTNSFILNKLWTFKSKEHPVKESLLFILVFLIAYSIQLGFLIFFKQFCKIGVEISQIISMIIYTIIGFIGNKLLTFKEQKSDEEL